MKKGYLKTKFISKKGMVIVCVMAIALSLTACGKDQGKNSSTEQTSTGTEQGSLSSETASSEPDQNNSQQGTPDEGGTEDTAGSSQAPGSDEQGLSAEMEAIRTAVVETLGENYWPNYQLPADMMEETFGVSSDQYDDYLAEMPMISTNVDTLVIIKAKEDKVKEVEDAVEAYREKLVNDTMQYPMNLGKIQASRTEVIDNYVCFVQLGADTTQAMDEGEEAVIEYCQEQNELAIEVIRGVITK